MRLRATGLASAVCVCLAATALIGCAERPAQPASPLRIRLDAALQMKFPVDQTAALTKVAEDAAADGDAEIAREAVNRIPYPVDKSQTAERCAIVLAKKGHLTGATQIAKEITFDRDRERVLSKIATGQVGD